MSYLSMIIFVIGSTIGAGIFFKNKNIAQLAHGDFGLVLATWGVAIFGILALALALIEVSSAQKTDRGTLEWTKLFTPKWFHKSSTNYVKYIFIPLTLFTMPIYVVNTFEDAGWHIQNAGYVLLLSFGIFAWFMIINLISFRFSEISQWVFTAVQTVPLIVLPIIAYAHPLDAHDIIHKTAVGTQSGVNGCSSWIALIAGISAISFAYDGFYVIASMKEKTSSPTKMGFGMVMGVAVVSMVYLFLTIAFNIGSADGTHNGIQNVSPSLLKAMNACIAVGIIGIINGYSMGAPRQFRGLAETGEAKEITILQKWIYRSKTKAGDKKQLEFAGWSYLFLATTVLFVSLGIVGAYGYNRDDWGAYGDYGTGTYLYSFSDTLVNFTSLLIFIVIATSVLGAIINRKTNKVAVTKNKFFIPAAWAAVIIFYAAGAYMVIASFLDMFNVTHDLDHDAIVGSVIKFLIFVAILAISIIPAFAVNIKAVSKACWAKITTRNSKARA